MSMHRVRRGAVAVVALAGLVGAIALARGSSEDPPGDPAAFCRHVAQLGELVAAAASGPEEIADVPAARSVADDIARGADELRDAAPEEIADGARTLAEVTGELARDLRDFYQAILDDSARANDPAFLSSFDPITEERRERLSRAGEDVRPWIAEHCTATE